MMIFGRLGTNRERYNMSKFVGAALLMIGLSGAAMAVQVVGAPEIDPGSAMTGLAMLAGTLAIVRGRRVRK
jgi:hypothetical protein